VVARLSHYGMGRSNYDEMRYLCDYHRKNFLKELKECIEKLEGKNLIKTNEAVDVKKIIKDIINTDWGGSNEEQGKAVQLLRGLAFSDD